MPEPAAIATPFVWRKLAPLALLLLAPMPSNAQQAPDSFAPLQAEYAATVRPIARQFCLECHSTAKKDGELDLERFASLAEIRRDPKAWVKVAEMLHDGEMPPKDAKQPTKAQKQSLADWTRRYLDAEARAAAGDPGPIVLRRLSNAEYRYTIADLAGVDLDPGREFPADGAAGEGFTNAGGAQAMSPALLAKYLDAGKDVARHAVLLPDGLRFSPSVTRSDWTFEALERIRAFYRRYAASGGGAKVNLQGVIFDTNDGGLLPIESYVAALLAERAALQSGAKSIAAVATERNLNAKYLGILWQALVDPTPSLALDAVRAKWRAAKPNEPGPVVEEIRRWQQALFRFASVGHIGKRDGPKAWQEAVAPLAVRQELRLKIPYEPGRKELSLHLVAGDAGDGNDGDYVVWERPRLAAPGRPELPLRELRAVCNSLAARRELIFANAAACLAAAAEAERSAEAPDAAKLAARHRAPPVAVAAWLECLGLAATGPAPLGTTLAGKLTNGGGHPFVNGWGSGATPSVMANASKQHVRIPGNLRPQSVVMHPSPTQNVAVAWRSPVAAAVRIEAKVQHAHPECGNGVTWSLELKRGGAKRRLAAGIAHGPAEVAVGPFEQIAVRPGDVIALALGPRDGNHSCDTTGVWLTLKAADKTWDLAADVAPDILAGNPHADRFGNSGVWHFYVEPAGVDPGVAFPPGSALARWQSAVDPAEKTRAAQAVAKLLQSGGAGAAPPDAALFRQLAALGGPLVGAARGVAPEPAAGNGAEYGLDPALFGKHPGGKAIDSGSLCVRAPAAIEVKVPADLGEGYELVVGGALERDTGAEGSVQLELTSAKPTVGAGARPSAAAPEAATGSWTSGVPGVKHAAPILAREGGAARKRIEAAFDAFRAVLPPALCYAKIVPVDEVVTLTLHYREDDALRRLMLGDAEAAELDRLWNELHYISRDALTLVDAYKQLMEYATQDGDPSAFEPLRKPIMARAEAFRKEMLAAEPVHVRQAIAFAAKAYRRPLADAEARGLAALYDKLRRQELPHEEALRMTLARILVAPEFLFRPERPGDGGAAVPVSDWELASRLSYFLWSSMPDEELRQVAAAGKLRDPATLQAQTRRMLADPKVRRLATEFGCQWLEVRNFDSLDEKSDRHFPEFRKLRGAMHEESIRFFIDFFAQDRSVFDLVDADYAFVNGDLAAYYGIPGAGAEWKRIDGARKFGRGGILAQAATLAKHSGASRTSPILRGVWISETLLGERMPKPPPGVPQLPDDEAATAGLTVRQLVEKHAADVKCAICHKRIDPLGFALEGYDSAGKKRDRDLGDRPIDVRTKTAEGIAIDGLDGLRRYLLGPKRDAFVRQFCRKLLGYALGRSVRLSDEPLLAEMQQALAAGDHKIGGAVAAIVGSRQFREIRGRANAND